MIHITLHDDENGKILNYKGDAVVCLVVSEDPGKPDKVCQIFYGLEPAIVAQLLADQTANTIRKLNEQGGDAIIEESAKLAKTFVTEGH